ncbi:probable protein phosphatase 2C 30 [Dendrobium catenatum]|uniref:protein-serine/threonine phosphatase n=1 Tax=Dendrobium catenatum TaxID=906689 RepID=A0A2I0W165_9ASPA|nr:probable protein phosphatase 2C 30 [Dendrobium catenatum]PKU69413.1 Protein phosphatase 2C 3 [Dendrobium catenatum]
MAEICLEIVGRESPAATVTAIEPCEKNTQAARRRRMQIRRLRCIAGTESLGSPVDLSRKRQRPDISVHPRVVLFKKDSDDVKETTSEQSPRYGMTSVCGLRREMEDAVSIWPDFLKNSAVKHSFFGVFDGHGCSHVAAWCKNRMHEMLEDEVDQLDSGLPTSPMEWEGVMDRSFSRMDAEVVTWGGAAGERRNTTCRCELQTPKCEHVGSTAVVAVVGPEHIVVANCGDSRAVLCRQGAAIPLSIDHKPDRPDEMQRIQAAGGRVIFWDGPRVQGVLAMSRAIGDGYLKPYVTAEPEVTVTERKEEDEFLILASDGLWDVVTNEMACQIVRMCLLNSRRGEVKDDLPAETCDKACSDAATLLTKMALARRSADNVSVVVVDLRMKL